MGIRTAILKHLDAGLGAWLCRVAGWIQFRFGRGNEITDRVPHDVRRVLVIRPGGMGDMLNLLPVIRALESIYPHAQLDLVCEKRNADVLKLAYFSNRTLLYDTNPLRFIRQLCAGRYDLAIDTEQFHHFSALFAWMSGAPVRIGFKINPRRNPLYTHLITYSLDGPEVEQFAALLKPLPSGDQEPSALHGVLAKHVPPLPPRALRDLADKTATGFVVLHTGASTPYKTWPSDRWAALAEKLHADLQVTVVVVGDRRDKPTIPQQQAVISYAGDLSLAETAALIGRARLFAGSDSGLAHLAVALGTPSAVLFGPSDQNKWGIETPEHAVVANPLPCAPCSIFGYLKPCRTRVCMASLTVDQVYDACRKVIAHGSPYQPEAQPYPSTPL